MATPDLTLFSRILEMRGIDPTPIRIQLLKLILDRGAQLFSSKELINEIKDKNLPISDSSVIVTLKLFHVRGLIKSDTNTTHSGIGRPEIRYLLVKK